MLNVTLPSLGWVDKKISELYRSTLDRFKGVGSEDPILSKLGWPKLLRDGGNIESALFWIGHGNFESECTRA